MPLVQLWKFVQLRKLCFSVQLELGGLSARVGLAMCIPSPVWLLSVFCMQLAPHF